MVEWLSELKVIVALTKLCDFVVLLWIRNAWALNEVYVMWRMNMSNYKCYFLKQFMDLDEI
jgi:hypothetical protein